MSLVLVDLLQHVYGVCDAGERGVLMTTSEEMQCAIENLLIAQRHKVRKESVEEIVLKLEGLIKDLAAGREFILSPDQQMVDITCHGTQPWAKERVDGFNAAIYWMRALAGLMEPRP